MTFGVTFPFLCLCGLFKKKKSYITNSEQETFELAKKYAKTLKSGDVVLLEGEMGAGKTAFSKGVAAGLGITQTVTSPTYAYMNDYNGVLYHYDCYRLDSGEQAKAMGLTDYFYGKGVCLIEWSQNISSALPKKVKKVTIVAVNQNQRKITL